MNSIYALLKLLALNYPLMLDCGYFFPAIPVFVTSDIPSLLAMEEDPIIITSQDSIRVAKEILISANSSLVFFELQRSALRSSSYNEKLNILIDALYYRRISNHSITCIPALLSSHYPDDEVLEKSFLLFPEEGINLDINPSQLILDIRHLPVIKELWAKEITCSPLEKSLLRGAACVYPDLNQYKTLEQAAVKVAKMNENARTYSGISELFIEDYRNWIQKTTAPSVPYDEMVLSENSRDCIVYSPDKIYLPRSLFEDLIKPMKQRCIPETILKEALTKTGILDKENTSTYEIKLRYQINNVEKSVRVYRLSLSAIDSSDLGFSTTRILRDKANTK